MINLKDKINKAATFRELKQIAENRYEHSWQPELQKDAFIDGAEALLKLLRIGGVVGQSEQLVAFLKWVGDGYNFENNAEKIVKEYIDEGKM